MNNTDEMKFSVLLSVYRREVPEYLLKALRSVWDQTCQPNEIVLVEDGPLTAELDRVIEQFQSECPVLKLVKLEENQQLGRALKVGLEQCSYELVARMDTDDLALPERFEQQLKFLHEHPEIDICGGSLEEFNDDEPNYHRIKTMPETSDELKRYARYRNPVNHMTVMFRKKAVLDAGSYRHMPFLEDYDLWTRMLGNGARFGNLPEVLIRMRVSEDMYARRGGKGYFRNYKRIRKQQKELGLLSPMEYRIALILTFGITRQPAFMRKMAYRKLLRKSN